MVYRQCRLQEKVHKAKGLLCSGSCPLSVIRACTLSFLGSHFAMTLGV